LGKHRKSHTWTSVCRIGENTKTLGYEHKETDSTSKPSHTSLGLSTLGLPSLLDLLDNRPLQRLGLGKSSPARDNLSISANEELLKVPLDVLDAHDTGLLLLHPGEDGCRILAVDVQLAEDREGHAVVDLAEGLDVIVGAGVLVVELVAGKAEDGELVRVALVQVLEQLLEAFELGCEAALGRGVDGEDDLAL